MPVKRAAKPLYKSPTEVRSYSFDYTDDLATGDSISSAETITVSPTGPVLSSQAVSGNLVQVRISGGTAGVEYVLTSQINTANGEVLTGTGALIVENP